ncbi:MAG: winged helix-turn-helix transcriptional regulator [Ignavibacteriae bacterium]|nr:winged helix-turn-helix transcriptional regulator [Ignavibacteriota bacterium]
MQLPDSRSTAVALQPTYGIGTEQERGPETTICIGELRVDIERELVFIADERIHLTGTEFRILRTLLMRSSAVIRRDVLLATIRLHTQSISSRSLDGHISRLRTKLGRHGAWIRTFKGIGYRFFPVVPL